MSAAATTTPRKFTPEEFSELENAELYELIDGELRERNVSFESSEIGAEILAIIRTFVRPPGLGRVLGADIGLQIFEGRPRMIRRPDVAFVAEARVTPEVRSGGYLRIPPDLVVEVISPNDKAHEIQAKVDLYLGAGVRLVWVAYPATRTVIAYRNDGSTTIFPADAQITGEDVVPGFAVRVSDLFPEPAAVEAGSDASD